MMIGTSITTLFVVCVISIVLCAFFYFRCVDLECKVDVLQASKDDLRESMSNTNYYLHKQLERVKREDEDDDKVFNAYITVLKISSATFVLSWLTLVAVAIVDSIIK